VEEDTFREGSDRQFMTRTFQRWTVSDRWSPDGHHGKGRIWVSDEWSSATRGYSPVCCEAQPTTYVEGWSHALRNLHKFQPLDVRPRDIRRLRPGAAKYDRRAPLRVVAGRIVIAADLLA